eukprot:scaffold255232_cov33-Tisochrysis_lutea.AAC.2
MRWAGQGRPGHLRERLSTPVDMIFESDEGEASAKQPTRPCRVLAQGWGPINESLRCLSLSTRPHPAHVAGISWNFFGANGESTSTKPTPTLWKLNFWNKRQTISNHEKVCEPGMLSAESTTPSIVVVCGSDLAPTTKPVSCASLAGHSHSVLMVLPWRALLAYSSTACRPLRRKADRYSPGRQCPFVASLVSAA